MGEGFEGAYAPAVVSEGALHELRDLAGAPPAVGKHWIMIDLDTGKLKWYQAVRRRFGGGRRWGGGGRRWGRR